MKISHIKNEDSSMRIMIDLDKDECSYLKHDLLGDQGIVDWFSKGPSSEKISKCKERMYRQMIPKLRDQGKSIPPSDQELLKIILDDPSYKNREAQELEKIS